MVGAYKTAQNIRRINVLITFLYKLAFYNTLPSWQGRPNAFQHGQDYPKHQWAPLAEPTPAPGHKLNQYAKFHGVTFLA